MSEEERHLLYGSLSGAARAAYRAERKRPRVKRTPRCRACGGVLYPAVQFPFTSEGMIDLVAYNACRCLKDEELDDSH